jgi:hypothetical protein
MSNFFCEKCGSTYDVDDAIYDARGKHHCPCCAKERAVVDVRLLRDYGSLRERIATACLAGLLANPNKHIAVEVAHIAAQSAVAFADALITVLDEPTPKAAVVAAPGKKKK